MTGLDKTKARLVYQSGHSNTWCDGENHQDTDGGWCHEDISYEKSWKSRGPRPCSCEFWGNPKP